MTSFSNTNTVSTNDTLVDVQDRYLQSSIPFSYYGSSVGCRPQEEITQCNNTHYCGKLYVSPAQCRIINSNESSIGCSPYKASQDCNRSQFVEDQRISLTTELSSNSRENTVVEPLVKDYQGNILTGEMVNNHYSMRLSTHDDASIVTTSVTMSMSIGMLPSTTTLVAADYSRAQTTTTSATNSISSMMMIADNSGKGKSTDKHSAEYRIKRERNNVAVRRSRNKTKLKSLETQERVSRLSKENEELRLKLDHLIKELSVLKNLFVSSGRVTSGMQEFVPATLNEVPTPVSTISTSCIVPNSVTTSANISSSGGSILGDLFDDPDDLY